MEHKMLVRSSHGVSQNTYHLVWVTKYRYPTFEQDGMKKVCHIAIRTAAKRYNIEILECRVLKDHIHMFARLPRTMSVSKAFQLLKGYTSYHIRKYQPWRKKYKAMWSAFTFSRTVGSVTGAVIEHYIKESNSKGQYGYQVGLGEFA